MKDMRTVLHETLGSDLSPGEVLRGLRVKAGLSQEDLHEGTFAELTAAEVKTRY